MADSASDKPERSPSDKDRSRQQSRQVSGKEAARSVGRGRPPGQPTKGRGQGRDAQRPQARPGARPGSQRSGARRPPARRGVRPGRSRSSLFIWGAVALVVVIVGVIVGVSQTSSPTTKGLHYTPRPVPAKVLHEITHVPTSAFDAVGTGTGGINLPTVVTTSLKPLARNGKPEVFGFFGQFCPYCAADRWAIIASLSRFGTFSGLKTMQSSPVDSFPRTQTFEFATATYTSPYLEADLVEVFGQDKATGSHPIIKRPSKEQLKLVNKLDPGATTIPIPYLDWGNKVVFPGASYTPQPLQTLSRTAIAASLSDPSDPITKLILGSSNYMSAAACSIDGGKPASVCTSSGIQAAAKALKLSV
ncbi:MAG: DUF929 family protein [Acidimicrobiales bacterium]